MKNNNINNYILIIHGPHMPLVSHRSVAKNKNITLNKINKALKSESKLYNIKIKIIQTEIEGRAVQEIQKSRKKTIGIIIFPGPWQKSAHSIVDIIKTINKPLVTVSIDESVKVLNGNKNIYGTDIINSCKEAIISIKELIGKGYSAE